MSGQAFPAVPGAGGGGTAIQSDGWFGHGVDGDLTTTGDVSLSRDTFYNNLTINAGHNVKPSGWHLYVLGTLTIAATGSINDDGNPGGIGASFGAGLTVRGALSAQSGAGGAGSSGGTNGSFGGGQGNATVNQAFALPSGGVGGSATNAGGVAGAAASYSTRVNLNTVWPCITLGHVWATGASSNLFNGGGGGGGGASSTAGTSGGGGGSGGGGVWVAAKTIINNGRISANGGAGGNASGAANGGGGGGGGGGYVVLLYQSGTLGTVTANGGTGGTPVGAGNAGANGVTGNPRVLKMG